MPRFDRIRKKIRRRRIETMLLAGYAFAVTCALFVSLLSKGNVAGVADTSKEEIADLSADVMTPAFNDAVNDNPFELAYIQVNNIKLLSENEGIASRFVSTHSKKAVVLPVVAKPQPIDPQAASYAGIYQKERRVLVVSPGDTFIKILTNLGMETQRATVAYQVLRKVFDARNLKVGQHIELTATFDVKSKELETLDNLVIEPVRGTRYILQVNEYDQFVAKVEQEEFANEVECVKGEINGYVNTSLTKAGVPSKLSGRVTQMFAHVINFAREVKKGDTFEVKYEVSKASDGEVVKVGDIVYASFTLGNRTHKLYRYKNRNGEVDYYDEKGQAKKTGLDKKPLAMRNARISSLFGYRRHPIYKTNKFHSGVDYAAPTGVEVYAAGPGVVEVVSYVNGYGNFIKIRHNSEYQTAYAHMHKFAAGIKKGTRVKKGQIIGYVGSTGRSTGPHLHFEIMRNGQRIDPLKAKVATGNDLYGAQLADFKRTVKKIDAYTASKADKDDNKSKEEKKKLAEKENGVSQNAEADKVVAEKKDSTPKDEPVKTAEKATVAIVKEDNEKIAKGEDKAVKSNVKLVYPPKVPAWKARNKKGGKVERTVQIKVPARKPKI